MSVVGAVTAGAAGLAAVLAAVNLYVSGRRELSRWKRETLVEAFVTFLDASFGQNAACRTLTTSGITPTGQERNRLRAKVVAAHDIETDTLTRLRLLAPSKVVMAAEALHEAEHRLVAASFAEPVPAAEALEVIRMPVRRARANLLESARATLRLRDTAGITHHHHETGWHEFLSSAHTGEEGRAPNHAGRPDT